MSKLFGNNDFDKTTKTESSLDRFVNALLPLTQSGLDGYGEHDYTPQPKKPLYEPSEEVFVPSSSQPQTQRDFRSLAFQILYAIDRSMYELTTEDIVTSFLLDYGLRIEKDSFSVKIVIGVVENRTILTETIKAHLLNWSMERLSCTVNLILMMATWEITSLQNPASVVIDEYVELAKAYGEADSYKIVNGILDSLAKNHGSSVSE